MTSASLAEQSSPGEEFRQLFARHYAFVWRSLLHLGLNEAAADDAAQEVFLVVHRKLEEYDRQRPFQTWVYGIARRVASTAQRSARRDEARALQVEHASQPQDPAKSLELKRSLDWVRRCLLDMPAEQREVFVLAEIEGMAVPEIAQAVAAPLNTVYSRLRLSRQRFAKELRDHQTQQQESTP